MSTMQPLKQQISQIIEQLSQNGYAIIDNFVDIALARSLSKHAQSLQQQGAMRKASTGLHKNTHQEFRGDFIHWIETLEASSEEQSYLTLMDELKAAINQAFFLGLFELESHFAAYPAGAGYKKHLDQFTGTEDRKITCILYLNETWEEADGGQLRMYLDTKETEAFVDVLPQGGRLVVFVSSDFLHEVLPAERERLSITGWFRTRSDKI
jgi:SM-20-related protein